MSDGHIDYYYCYVHLFAVPKRKKKEQFCKQENEWGGWKHKIILNFMIHDIKSAFDLFKKKKTRKLNYLNLNWYDS